MEVVPYKAEHLMMISLQESQQYLGAFVNEDLAKSLEIEDWSWTGIEDGKVLGCSGVMPIWAGRGMAWAYIASDASHNQFIKIHRAVKKFLDNCYLKRIEMTVDCSNEPAHRWAGMLGFSMEAGRLESYTPSGADVSLYARVRS